MRGIAATIAVLALAACTYPEEEPNDGRPGLPSLATDQSKPQLALMDHVLGNYFASDIPNRPTVCVSANDGRNEEALAQEDELALIQRYEALAPFSRCALIDNGWRDAETEEPAMLYILHGFTCSDDSSCSGFVSYMAGKVSSPTNLYRMDYSEGSWSFARDDRLIAGDGEAR